MFQNRAAEPSPDEETAQARKPQETPDDLGGLVAEFRGRLVVVPWIVIGSAVGLMIGHSGAAASVIAGLIVGVAAAAGLFLLGLARWRQLSVKVYSGGLAYRAKGANEIWKWDEVEELFILAEKREIHSAPHGIADAIISPFLEAVMTAALPKAARYRVRYRIRRRGQQRTFDSPIRHYARLGELIQELVTQTQLPVALATFRSGNIVPFGELLLGPNGLACASAKHPRLLPLSALAGVSVSLYDVKVHQVGQKRPWLTAERTAVPNAAILAGLAERIVDGKDLRDSDDAESGRASGRGGVR